MLLLMLFALLAGAGTAITPCVLPVVPALLSASAVGGRRRPLGIVLGLAITFTIAIVALAQLVKGVGLASGAARDLAIAVLAVFGVVMLFGDLAARLEAPLSRLGRFGPRSRGTGFWSGLGVGAALGFVCAPCAGPILAAVTAVSASNGPSLRIVLVALSFAAGMSGVMLLYGLGGRAVIARIRRVARGRVVERSLAVIMLLTAVAMVFNLDVRFEEALAKDRACPRSSSTRLARSRTQARCRTGSRRCGRVRGSPSPEPATEAAAKPMPPALGVAIPGVKTPSLPDLGPPPSSPTTSAGSTHPADRPLTLSGLHGHVVLVDFWTYTCINCIRTLPFLKGLYATYRPYGLEIVGVETPEFTFEQEAGNVLQAISPTGSATRSSRTTTTAPGTLTERVLAGRVPDRRQRRGPPHKFGEGDYKQSEAAVRELLYQAGVRDLPPPMTRPRDHAVGAVGTPETYLESSARRASRNR